VSVLLESTVVVVVGRTFFYRRVELERIGDEFVGIQKSSGATKNGSGGVRTEDSLAQTKRRPLFMPARDATKIGCANSKNAFQAIDQRIIYFHCP
jgi:hypothetical protein